jgi:hypothetical protein
MLQGLTECSWIPNSTHTPDCWKWCHWQKSTCRVSQHPASYQVCLSTHGNTGLENREYGRGDPLRWPHDTLYPPKLAITSMTTGGRSVGVVRSRTQATELLLLHMAIWVLQVEHKQSYRSHIQIINQKWETRKELFVAHTLCCCSIIFKSKKK